ncbi:fructosamine kinase family protein [Blastochloris viridis]|uniref:Fructosamine-3-kinase n=1 Tax=Blastochloris viridis TaxID=1079 RepID=A0A0H5BBM0_BLAVI|nr:fructosamine kinase family protein [Blastochloris viridis]ALK08231.1 Fructosamine kinase [Blastochloris viridis]BAR98504.1 ribulosamine/erythrulosamine 3-kinase [Blastochloris viridis]CUU44153.1 Fructosamine-3-kinase [Blastochloris viridis]
MTALAGAGAALLGGRLVRAEPLSGGDLSQIVRITLADGRVAIVKNGPAPRTEAAMLAAIGAAGAPAPMVLAASDDALVIEALPAGGSLRNAWGSLGAALAGLHRCVGPRYGWDADFAFGRVAIENTWTDDWPTFWAERRLLTSLSQVPAALARRLEALAADLPNRLPRHPPPSLLHGDLWGGNVLVEDARVSGLIDPACYFGHAEVDLAMLTLFDRPGPAFYHAYGVLEPGADDRLVIYRLWPALVHLRLFGGGYRGMVEGFLAAARA